MTNVPSGAPRIAGLRAVDNWREVLAHAWSVRLIILSVILDGIEVFVQLAGGWLPVTPGLFLILSLLTTVAAGIARFVAQKTVGDGERQTILYENGED